MWNPKRFNGTSILRVPSDRVWRPDIVLYNSVNEEDYRSPLPITIQYDGTVSYLTPYIYICYCKVDLTFYPFDTQICRMKFGSWAHDKLQVDIISAVTKGEIDSYQPNGEWDLIDIDINREEDKFSCCPNAYSTLTFSLKVKRNSDFYIYNLILPYLMISLLSIFVFYLPPDSGEKMTLSITVMLSLVVFNQLVFASIPPASDGTFPIIGKYFIVMIAMVALSVIMSVISLHIFHQQSSLQKMPKWLHTFLFSFLARIICNCTAPVQATIRRTDFQSLIRKETLELEERANGYHGETEGLIDGTYVSNNIDNSYKSPNFSTQFRKVEKEIKGIVKSLEYLTLRKRQKEKDFSVAKEWKDGAAIFDRTLLLIFVTVNTIFPLFFILAATGCFF
ncbi:neuronal acetylcholine receptor subunit alpha-3-like isoform X2 [Anneissia japonica]|nr:neuronal acetylcholine receptor subunit alpha-3-like isoform X2 [Anneissia japonica]